ncbi:MAG TPA: TonB-dependent receptor [Blastocatellia bacterium]|nr:TonB-dependent receptor [Blastocatellia bacterium]
MMEAKRFLMMSLLFVVFPTMVFGQQTSSITGVVTDTTGAVIRGAEVKLTDTKTAKEQLTKTDDQGVYLFLKVSPGANYLLSFRAQGFDSLAVSNVTLGVGVTETHNVQMTVGQVSNTVTIASSGEATLNTTDASIGNVIDSRRLRELPIQIRESPAALLGLQAGVIGNNVGTATTNRVGSVTGARADQGNITIDGIDANDQATGQAFATIGNAPIDAIQEFRTVSTNPAAADGRSSGAQIMMVTKGGTNEFHGNLREYNRTAATAANTFFNNRAGIDRTQLTRNQFGGSIGGPVYLPRFGQGGDRYYKGKDRLFFFFDYEGRREAQGVAYLRIVPLNHFRNGNLGYLNNTPNCPANARLNTRPECVSILPATGDPLRSVAGIDPQGVGSNQALLSFLNSRYPQANDLTAGDGINTGGFRFNSPSHRSGNTYTTRIDLNATNNQKIFGRFNIGRTLRTDTVNTVAQQFPNDPESGQIVLKDYAFVGGHTWTINSNLVNQATVGVTRSGAEFPAPFAPSFPNVYGNPDVPTGGTFGGIGIAAPFADISTQTRNVPVPTIRDDVSWAYRSHSMSFGISIKPIRSNSSIVNDFNFVELGIGGNTPTLNAGLRPQDIGGGTTPTQNYDAAFAFLLGRYQSIGTNFNYDTMGNAFAPGTGKSRKYRYNEYEVYAQDSWRARNDLTITYGVRWQYYQPPYEANGFQAANNVDFQTLFDARVRNAAAGISGATSEPLLSYDLIGKGNNARAFYAPDRNNFAPRLNFAWNPSFKNGFLNKMFGDRKTVIRTGGSMVYDRVGGALTFVQDQATFLFDNARTTQFGEADPRAALMNGERFTGIGNLPRQNTAPSITRPFTPFVDASGRPIGTEQGQNNYALAQNFKTPYSIQYSFGIQRELPRDFLLEVSYVGRQARKLFTQADASQILDFKDPVSGQFMLTAFNALQANLQAGGAITPQPWFENQIAVAGGTNFLANNFADLILIGDTSDTIQALYANGVLAPNVGLSSQFATNAYVTNLGSSSYNGVLASLRKRFSQGLEFDFNYTYSHSIDNQSNVANTTLGGLVCDVRNLRVCRGNSDFDVRHLINVNGIYELPFGRGRRFGGQARGLLNSLIGGWQVSGLFTYRTGLAFGTTTGSFPVGFVFNSPAVLTGANVAALQQSIHDDGSTIQFFGDQAAALDALRYPNHGETGNRNNLRGPGFWNVDTGVMKQFRLPWSETQRLEFRWEAFNTFNHHAFGLPNANIASPLFGQITTSATAPREMQFALRFEF